MKIHETRIGSAHATLVSIVQGGSDHEGFDTAKKQLAEANAMYGLIEPIVKSVAAAQEGLAS